jgi:hypothetical protein
MFSGKSVSRAEVERRQCLFVVRRSSSEIRWCPRVVERGAFSRANTGDTSIVCSENKIPSPILQSHFIQETLNKYKRLVDIRWRIVGLKQFADTEDPC